MTAALEFTDVRKSFTTAPALAGVSMAIHPGEFFGLAGLNGAGKTTLIKCLLDLSSADAGRIAIFGTPSTRHTARARISFLPERFNPPYYLNGRDFLRMMANLNGVDYAEAEALAVLRRLDLDLSALAKPVRAFSKGMTQKLGLAWCFIADRDLTILDEPMSGLDPRARAGVKDLLSELKQRGRTLFFTSHALADMEEICDRVAVMHAGAIRFVGAPDELLLSTGSNTLERAFLRAIDSPRFASQ